MSESALDELTRLYARHLASGDDAWVPDLNLVLPSYWQCENRSVEVFRLSDSDVLSSLNDAALLATRSGRETVTLKDLIAQAGSGTHLGAYHTSEGLRELALMMSLLTLECGTKPSFGPIGRVADCVLAARSGSLTPLLLGLEDGL